MRNRLALRYSIHGDLRFISHHDTLRLFQRAFVRAGLPLLFSEGFNPRPRISIVLPRPVGVASNDDLVVVDLANEMTVAEADRRLADQLPDGLRIIELTAMHMRDRRVPVSADYRLALRDGMDATALRTAAEAINASASWLLVRETPKRPNRRIDLRVFLNRVDVMDDAVTWRQSISQDGTVRVGEVLEALKLSQQDHLHRVVRDRVVYAA